MFQDWFRSILSNLVLQKYYFKHDYATPHTDYRVKNFLKVKMGKKLMDKYKLHPFNIFLWEYLKQKVYSPLPQNLDERKMRILFKFNDDTYFQNTLYKR